MTSNGSLMDSVGRADIYSCQQSPFFRHLPQEIRDQIYQEYFFQQDGYVYQSSTGKLTNSDGSLIRLDFMYTCRAAADETRGFALKTNCITFRTSPAVLGESMDDKYGRMTRSERFRRLLGYVAVLKAETLYYAGTCVTQEIIVQVKERFPEAGKDFELAIQEAIHGGDDRGFVWYDPSDWSQEVLEDNHQSIREALDLAFNLVSSRPDFETQASRILDSDTGRGPLRHFADWSSIYEVLKWNPEPWAIPNELELSRIEKMIIWDIKWTFGGIPSPVPMEKPVRLRYRFSAGSIAIDFLKRHANHRQYLRLIRILEDENSISNPWNHLYGLVPFYLENPKLKIEWHVSLLNGVLPHCSRIFPDIAGAYSLISAESWLKRKVGCGTLMESLIQWIDVAINLPIPSDSFSVIFDSGSKDDTAWSIWNTVKQTLMLYEAIFKCAEMRNLDKSLLTHRFYPRYSPDGVLPVEVTEELEFTSPIHFHEWHGVKAYPSSWLLENFVLVVKNMILRNSTRIRFPDSSPLEPVWDIDGLMERVNSMSIKEMRDKWTKAISVKLPFPAEWATDICKTYLFNNHYIRRMLSAQPSDVLVRRVQPSRRSGQRRKKAKALASR